MITRVTIHVESKNLHFCEVFTDEETLTKECDEWLDAHDLNDGCSGFTTEEVIALNSILAEKFDDPYNADHYVCCDELYGTLEDAVRDKIHHYGYDEEQLLKIAEILEIDPKQL
jgi:hypothetical protein